MAKSQGVRDLGDGAKILLGVSGSIAAFKAAKLASDLVAERTQVRAVMTSGATHFVTPLTFEAITGQPVGVRVWDEQPGSSRMGHIELAKWADVMVVAPASADSLARLALGLADDLLGAISLSTRAPLILAPAMETGMWTHPATQAHVALLRQRGARIVGPETGRLASGASGSGRMSEPADILDAIRAVLARAHDLHGLKVLITAGPTFEPVDPVRFIGNHSSGKTGYALVEEAVARGAEVTLIAGPTALPDPPSAAVVHVQTAREMERAVLDRIADRDVVIMAAAIADFTPTSLHTSKLKRNGVFSLELEPTDDIASAASRAAPRALHVGFALETDDLLAAAAEKMRRKGQQLVVANQLSASHNPFGSDDNVVTLVHRDGLVELPKMSKRDVARAVWDDIRTLLDLGAAT